MTTSSRVDWNLPPGPPNPLYGAGARTEEKALVQLTAITATAVVIGHAVLTAESSWMLWQYVLAAVLVFDLAGGVVANGLNTAKRDHHTPSGHVGAHGPTRLLRRPVLFTALHLHPVLVGLVFPGGTWWWGLCVYAVVLAAVIAVRCCPLYLQRPMALAACSLTAVVAPLAGAPDGFWWLPPVIVLKLALAHAVQEEPYRPVTSSQRHQRGSEKPIRPATSPVDTPEPASTDTSATELVEDSPKPASWKDIR
ncbi:hypothetical protein [Kocuria sp. NPDC057446]|uniref:hypothetical protein n=1 Tax=Kocuria sp. NPDC057446 TaxID=3346137 RepID=UPI00368657FC